MNTAAEPTTTKGTKKASKASKSLKGTGDAITLEQLAERYLKHLEHEGRSRGTTFSYEMDLAIAKGALGAETPVASITPDRVKEFFESDAVTKTRKGRAKAKPTIDKTRRVLRLALTWAAERKLIAQAPLPTNENAAPDAQA